MAAFPALSRQLPATVAAPRPGRTRSSAASQPASPESPSAPANATATGFVYQPPPSGSRSGVAAAVGGVASYFSVSDAPALLPALSTQVPARVAPAVSGPP